MDSGAGSFGPGTVTFSGGGLALNKNASVPSYQCDGGGGDRAGSATLTVTGTSPSVLNNCTISAGTTTWTGGNVSTQTNNFQISTATVNLNSGVTFTYASGGLFVHGGATLNVNAGATLDMQGDRVVGGGGVINVAGALNRSSGTGTAGFDTQLGISGTLAQQSTGRLELHSSGASAITGSITYAASSTLSLGNNHTLGTGGTINGTGTLSLDGGTLTVQADASTFTTGALLFSGGGLALNKNATVPSYQCDGGGGDRAGSATLTVTGTSPSVLNNCTISAGTTTWTGGNVSTQTNNFQISTATVNLNSGVTFTYASGGLFVHGGATLNVNAGATLDMQGDRVVGGGGVINVAGTLNRSSGTGTAGFDTQLGISGTLAQQSTGRLELHSSGASAITGSITYAASSTLSLGNNHTLGTGGTINGTGTLSLDGGTLTVQADATTFTTGALLFSGGGLALNKNATVPSYQCDGGGGDRAGSATLTVTGTSPSVLNNCTISAGTTTWTGGNVSTQTNNFQISTATVNLNSGVTFTYASGGLFVHGGATLNVNAGATLDMQGDRVVGGGGVINVAGTLNRSSGTGTAGFDTQLGISGTLAQQSTGRLELRSSGASAITGSITYAASSTLSLGNNHTLGTGGTINGTGTLSLDGGTLTVQADASHLHHRRVAVLRRRPRAQQERHRPQLPMRRRWRRPRRVGDADGHRHQPERAQQLHHQRRHDDLDRRQRLHADQQLPDQHRDRQPQQRRHLHLRLRRPVRPRRRDPERQRRRDARHAGRPRRRRRRGHQRRRHAESLLGDRHRRL